MTRTVHHEGLAHVGEAALTAPTATAGAGITELASGAPMGARVLTVVIVDAEPVFVEGVRRRLAGGRLRYLDQAGDLRAALALCARLAPDVVLVDPRVDRCGYLTATVKRAQHPPLVVALADDEPDGVEPLRAAGADAVLARTVSAGELTTAVERAERARAGDPCALVPGERPRVPAWSITRRQYEVLCLIAAGQDNEDIAAELGVTPETVRTHVKGIRRALRATSRAHAVGRAFALGLLPPGPCVAGYSAPN